MAGQDETKHNEDEVVSENDIDISDQEQVSEENMTEGNLFVVRFLLKKDWKTKLNASLSLIYFLCLTS